MKQYDAGNLIIHPGGSSDRQVVVEVTPEKADWEFIHYQLRRFAAGETWQWQTGEHELALVVLGGVVSVASSRGVWQEIGGRANVFSGLPQALYLPRRTEFTLTARSDTEVAAAWVPTDQDHPAQRITPADVTVEIRGGENATRQINRIIPPGFDCHRLVVVEVLTPSGGWSSYPPHKHDVHRLAPDGSLLEADLEEIYAYKLSRPEGYAIQRVYTGETSPLARAGKPIDALLMPRENDVVLVPEGYHPVVLPPGYTGYYLNVLAGSAQALTAEDDPAFTWVKRTFKTRNPAVPFYDLSGAKQVV